MVVRVTHAKVSGKPTGTDPTRIYGSHWDDDHVVAGLENVDNTSDLDKPVSTAVQTLFNSIPPVREKLIAPRTYYVRTDGSDSNNGLANSASGAFATGQKALNVIFGTLDLGGFDVDIQLGNAGTYTGNWSVTSAQVGAGTITVKGDVNPANTGNYILTSASGNTISVAGYGARLSVQGVEIRAAVQGVTAVNGGNLRFSGYVRFGACASAHMRANNGIIEITGISYAIVGGATIHYWSSPNGYLNSGTSTVTVPAATTVNFSSAFAVVDRQGQITASGMTFTILGTLTGVRYTADTQGLIYTNNAGASYFPGNSSGVNNGNGAIYY